MTQFICAQAASVAPLLVRPVQPKVGPLKLAGSASERSRDITSAIRGRQVARSG